MSLSEPLEEIRRNSNAALASIGIGLRIECRGRRLNLRGLLPMRQQPGQRSVQRLSLGLENNRDGLLEAEQIARVIDAQLKRDQFRWEQWIKPPEQRTTSCSAGGARALLDQQLQTFEQVFFADPRRRRSPSGSRTTWTGAYNPYLRRLRTLAGMGTGPIGADLLLQTLHSYPDGSRSRQQLSLIHI